VILAIELYFTRSNFMSILQVIFSVRVYGQIYKSNVCVVFVGRVYGFYEVEFYVDFTY